MLSVTNTISAQDESRDVSLWESLPLFRHQFQVLIKEIDSNNFQRESHPSSLSVVSALPGLGSPHATRWLSLTILINAFPCSALFIFNCSSQRAVTILQCLSFAFTSCFCISVRQQHTSYLSRKSKTLNFLPKSLICQHHWAS